MAGPDNANGSASSLTGASPLDRRARIALRVGSASAENTIDSAGDCMEIVYPKVKYLSSTISSRPLGVARDLRYQGVRATRWGSLDGPRPAVVNGRMRNIGENCRVHSAATLRRLSRLAVSLTLVVISVFLASNSRGIAQTAHPGVLVAAARVAVQAAGCAPLAPNPAPHREACLAADDADEADEDDASDATTDVPWRHVSPATVAVASQALAARKPALALFVALYAPGRSEPGGPRGPPARANA